MCDKPNVFTALVEGAPAEAATPPRGILVDLPSGSRRRRLWELPSQALCPVIGVCLPMPLLRRRFDKLNGGTSKANDYELHCGAINECNRRTPTAEVLQKELDQRYIRALRDAAKCKTTLMLRDWWDSALTGSNPAGSLWATLTHARCDEPLMEQVLRDIHMLQHQVGAANRADLQRLEELVDENAVLGRELARAQARSTRLLQERATQIEQQAADIVKLRAELLGRDTLAASLADEIRALEAATPGLRSRQEQAGQIRMQLSRIHELERALLAAQQRADREQSRAEELQRELERSAAAQDLTPATADEAAALPRLDERSVLCVGGRQAVVPVYRQLIERIGGRFLHHDGGEEDAVTKLDASLAAADLVICQTGCISHDAYWRVKDHCKRHGKQCVFVDKPSASGLRRALDSLGTAERAEALTQQPGQQD
ncbi:DUF2325 domain-containing protein [Paucibacter sp. R3-3]|uniref:DUF2325 domain-containing protein n=1 Tax=Roseateles agri TaxID=3098619 RepID=A0ABU5DD40_9BURK|nr:DUF2325 domain-containing protein [Paucibacter sp. R3-3]MDY0744199.1 DUF2325 domain-containing protein [Paucibacter sp. R3-3]